MCGRFTLTITFEELVKRYAIEDQGTPFHRPRYNVAPMQQVPAIINDGSKNRLGELRWGLVPSWAKDDKFAGKTINARGETLLEKPSFKNLVYRKRCIIPADSFFEWINVEGQKRPIRFLKKDNSIFSMAGLYDTWINPTNGAKMNTCTIITTTPNKLVSHVHDRMPVILKKEDEQKWLKRNEVNVKELLRLLMPFPTEEMLAYPVSTLVGNVKNEGPECIERIKKIK
ncbi:SOS response-associated peptidase [Metabacillus litoralis]|jgi:putative SOS response-associated peptidase YedK|uniref:SOS response-associated peptidase n=1 Tax=Metabacillus litoralis TaxID=152268 RepID=UPI002040807D|nr:SOS response-associated peptidase [Metabacillus litoralis]MCM3653380.1 SOS response-associated peptidase [Metabacillus litoralis]